MGENLLLSQEAKWVRAIWLYAPPQLNKGAIGKEDITLHTPSWSTQNAQYAGDCNSSLHSFFNAIFLNDYYILS